MQQIFEHIFDRLYVGYGIHINSREIIILFSMCRYAQSCAFISVIELPRIPTYCPKNAAPREGLQCESPDDYKSYSLSLLCVTNSLTHKRALLHYLFSFQIFPAITHIAAVITISGRVFPTGRSTLMSTRYKINPITQIMRFRQSKLSSLLSL